MFGMTEVSVWVGDGLGCLVSHCLLHPHIPISPKQHLSVGERNGCQHWTRDTDLAQ